MSFREYVEAGFALCKFDPGTKGPSGVTARDWNRRERAITNPQRVNGMVQGGLLHAYSNTCSIDIDNLNEARPFLAAHGVDIDELLAARSSVQIVSGRPNRAKLIYRLDTPLQSKKLARYKNILDGKHYHALELRCATRGGLSVQDVLPPSIHPGTGKPYEWKFGNELTGTWRNLPPLPPALLALWQEASHDTEEPAPRPSADLVGEIPADGPSLDELRFYLEHHDPDGPYDEWVAVGMALHDATGGAPEALVLWDEWSRKGTKYGEAKGGQPPQYPTDKWHSFTPGHGYTIGYLKSKAPPYVPLDSFPVVAEAEFKVQPDIGTDTRPGAIIRRALEPLVLVTSQGAYYHKETRGYLSMQTVEHLYTPLMPVVQTTGNNGAVKSYQPNPVHELKRATWKKIVHGVGLNPGGSEMYEEDGRQFLNCWAPMAEPLQPSSYELEVFNAMFGRPDEKVFRDWLMCFFGHAVQKPHIRINMAPLIVGYATGSGKNTLMEVLPRTLFGSRHFNTMTHATLKSDFSDKLADTWWLYFSELHSGSNKSERISIIKKIEPWITDKYIEVHPKGGKPYDIRNRVQPLASSNFEDDAIYVDDNDRRWCIGHIANPLTPSEAAEIYRFLESERAPGVLHHIFRGADITGFNPKGRAPDTSAKQVMVSVNYGLWEARLLEMMEGGIAPFDKDIISMPDALPFMGSGMTAVRLGRILARAPFHASRVPPSYGKRLWAWRNQKLWDQMGPKAQYDHYTSGVRPEGYPWETGLPASLAAACGFNSA
jgi:hypothetical protein